jgi:hypothetical protein
MRLSTLFGIAVGLIAAVILVYSFAIRPWHERWGTTPTEATATFPGDDLIPGAVGQVTREITVNAPPEKVWPWLMQIGQDRSGFYSYTPLENLFGADMPEVHELRACWPARLAGETVWFGTPKRFNGQAKMIAAIVDAPRAFVLIGADDWQSIARGGHGTAGSWGFFLVPVDATHTRLITRLRSGPPPSATARVVGAAFWGPAHFIMERKMLLTLKQLAEQEPSSPGPRS